MPQCTFRLLIACLAMLMIHSIAAPSSKKSERFYEFGSNVIKLNDEKQFKREVMESSFLWAIEFYREGCGYCQLLTPVWEKVAEHLKNLVRVAAVDTERSGSLAANHADPSNPIQAIFILAKIWNTFSSTAVKPNSSGCTNNKDLHSRARPERQAQGGRLQW